jgi:uncharacterized protein (UPF0332 family)
MTDENRRANVAIEIARADRAMRSARILLGSGEPADAVSRAYYAALHYARALLLTEGTEPQTHRGVLRLLSRDFVRTGRLPAGEAAALSKLEKQRLEADYSAELVFTNEEAALELQAAESFIDAAMALLRRDGWVE